MEPLETSPSSGNGCEWTPSTRTEVIRSLRQLDIHEGKKIEKSNVDSLSPAQGATQNQKLPKYTERLHVWRDYSREPSVLSA